MERQIKKVTAVIPGVLSNPTDGELVTWEHEGKTKKVFQWHPSARVTRYVNLDHHLSASIIEAG